MITIWKYELDQVENHIDLPPSSVVPAVLHVDNQDNRITAWVKVDTRHHVEDWILYVAGTGTPIPDAAGDHVGSCLVGEFVFHVFIESPFARAKRLAASNWLNAKRRTGTRSQSWLLRGCAASGDTSKALAKRLNLPQKCYGSNPTKDDYAIAPPEDRDD